MFPVLSHRRVLVAALAIAPITLAPAPAMPADSASHGTMVRMEIDSAALHDHHRSVRVYLPASYAKPEAQTRRYPVVYFLHGWPGGDGNWPGSGRAIDTLDSLIATRRIPDVIGVMPNGSGIGIMGRSMYVDSWDGKSRMAEFIVKELPAWVDRTYRTRPEPAMRGILGLSDGGFGAFNLAFHHPDVFGAAASHSGHFEIVDDVSIRRVIGEGATAERVIEDNDAYAYVTRAAPELRRMPIYFDCGMQDEDLAANRALDRKLTSLGIPHVYREFPGNHGWGYWRGHLHESLIALTAKM